MDYYEQVRDEVLATVTLADYDRAVHTLRPMLTAERVAADKLRLTDHLVDVLFLEIARASNMDTFTRLQAEINSRNEKAERAGCAFSTEQMAGLMAAQAERVKELA